MKQPPSRPKYTIQHSQSNSLDNESTPLIKSWLTKIIYYLLFCILQYCLFFCSIGFYFQIQGIKIAIISTKINYTSIVYFPSVNKHIVFSFMYFNFMQQMFLAIQECGQFMPDIHSYILCCTVEIINNYNYSITTSTALLPHSVLEIFHIFVDIFVVQFLMYSLLYKPKQEPRKITV